MENPTAFSKLSGAKNSFLVTDQNRIQSFLSYLKKIRSTTFLPHNEKESSYIQPHHFLCFWSDMSHVASLLCSYLNIDGFCYLVVNKNNKVHWSFFNKDGSEAFMCGNASCAIVEYLYKRSLIPLSHSPIYIQIKDKIIQGELIDNQGVIHTSTPQIESLDKNLKLDHQSLTISKVHSGVPHLLIEEGSLKNKDLTDKESYSHLSSIARKLRSKNPDSNITFYKQEDPFLKVVSYERGVEDFTLSCGTGALAASYLMFHKNSTNQKTNVLMPGGVLKTSFSKEGASLQSPVTWDDSFFPYDE